MKSLFGCRVAHSTNFAAILSACTISARNKPRLDENHVMVIGILPSEGLWYVPIFARREEEKGPMLVGLPNGAADPQGEIAETGTPQKFARSMFKAETGFTIENIVLLGHAEHEEPSAPRIPVFAGTINTHGRFASSSAGSRYQKLMLFPLDEWVRVAQQPEIIPVGFALDSAVHSATLLAVPRLNANEGLNLK